MPAAREVLDSVNFYFINVQNPFSDFHQDLNKSARNGVLAADHCIVSVQHSINISTVMLAANVIIEKIIFIDGDCCNNILQSLCCAQDGSYNSFQLIR